MNIKIHTWDDNKKIDIDGVDFTYSNMKNMYGNLDGIGMQSNLVDDRKLEKMCNEIADIIYKYLEGEK